MKLNRAKTNNKQLKLFSAIIAFVFSLGSIFVHSQTPPPPLPPAVQPELPRTRAAPAGRRIKTVEKIENQSGVAAEKSIAVDLRVNVQLCVSEGRVRINGWERNEIRAYVDKGSEVSFKVQEKDRQSGVPVWVSVLGFEPRKTGEINSDECLSGEQIEIDVPRGAIVNVKGRTGETTISSVAKVTVDIVGGNIILSGIGQGIAAKTYEGDVTVENSGGAMNLTTTTGNIVVFDVDAREVGDVLKAKTNSGAIVLQQAAHRRIEADSHSGSIKFSGELLNGGQYKFNAFNGSINLLLAQNASGKINVSYGYGSFNSEIALQNVVKSAPANTQNLSAQIGAGDATLNLSTFSGTIQIKKQ